MLPDGLLASSESCCIGHYDDGGDLKRTRFTNGSKGIPQHINGFVRIQDRVAEIRHKREDKGVAGNDGASTLHGKCRVTLR